MLSEILEDGNTRIISLMFKGVLWSLQHLVFLIKYIACIIEALEECFLKIFVKALFEYL